MYISMNIYTCTCIMISNFRDDMYSFNSTGATWRMEEKEELMKRMNVLEKALPSTITENRAFRQLINANTNNISKHTTILNQYQERFGTGEVDINLVVRQKEKQMERKDFKDLVIEEKDIVKVIILHYLYYLYMYLYVVTCLLLPVHVHLFLSIFPAL